MAGLAGAVFLLLEDAAQVLGACYRGRPAGSFGRAAAVSFYPAKTLERVLKKSWGRFPTCQRENNSQYSQLNWRQFGRLGNLPHESFGTFSAGSLGWRGASERTKRLCERVRGKGICLRPSSRWPLIAAAPGGSEKMCEIGVHYTGRSRVSQS